MQSHYQEYQDRPVGGGTSGPGWTVHLPDMDLDSALSCITQHLFTHRPLDLIELLDVGR